MKKILLGAILLFSITMNAQALEIGKYYKATIKTDNGTMVNRYYVGNSGSVYLLDDDNEFEKFDNTVTIDNGTTTTFSWLNAGGIWSESQTYIFTKDIKSGDMYIVFLRVVQNEGQDPWTVAGIGIVEEE